MEKKRIMVVDDHKLIRDALKTLINADQDMEVVGEAGDGQQAIRMAVHRRPDLLLQDLSMPGLDGLSVLGYLKREIPDTKILVMTLHKTEEYAAEAFKAGADGYFVKTGSWEELHIAIRQLIAGKNYFSPVIAGYILEGYIQGKALKIDAGLETVTRREREVLKLMAGGYERKEIAALLSISRKTVEKHLNNLMRKLNLHSATTLVNYAFEHGLKPELNRTKDIFIRIC